MKKIVYALSVLTIVVSAFTLSCEKEVAQEKKQVTLAVNVTTYSSPVYVALAKGFWKDEGLSITREGFAAGRFCLEAILGGRADFGTVAEAPLVFAGFAKQEAYVVATMASGDVEMKIIGRKDHGVSSPADLKGKRIGLMVSTTSEFFLYLFLTEHGMSTSDVELVNLKPAEMPAALINGDIDAFSVWEPFVYNARKELVDNAVVFIAPKIYELPFNIVVSQELAEKYPETVKRILKGLLKAEEYIKNNREEALEIISKEVGMPTDVLSELTEDIDFTLKLDKEMLPLMEKEARWAIDRGYAPKEAVVPNYRYMFYTEALKELRSASVTIE